MVSKLNEIFGPTGVLQQKDEYEFDKMIREIKLKSQNEYPDLYILMNEWKMDGFCHY